MDKQTMTQCSVVVPNHTGMLAQVTNILARERINIESLLTESHGDLASFRFVFERTQDCRKKLEGAGLQVLEQQVLCLELPNRTGELNRLCRSLADNDIDILYVYGSSRGPTAKLVLAVDQPEKAAPLVQEAGASFVTA